MSRKNPNPKNTVIRIRQETRERIERVTRERGWTIAEAVSRAVDALDDADEREPRKVPA